MIFFILFIMLLIYKDIGKKAPILQGGDELRKVYIRFYLIHKAMRDKVKVEFDRDVLNALLKLKEVGDTYSDVVRRLLKEREEAKR